MLAPVGGVEVKLRCGRREKGGWRAGCGMVERGIWEVERSGRKVAMMVLCFLKMGDAAVCPNDLNSMRYLSCFAVLCRSVLGWRSGRRRTGSKRKDT